MQRDAMRHVRKEQPTGCPIDGGGAKTIASGERETGNADLPCRERVDGCEDSTSIPHTVQERLRFATMIWVRIFPLERRQCYLRMHGLCFWMGGCETRLCDERDEFSTPCVGCLCVGMEPTTPRLPDASHPIRSLERRNARTPFPSYIDRCNMYFGCTHGSTHAYHSSPMACIHEPHTPLHLPTRWSVVPYQISDTVVWEIFWSVVDAPHVFPSSRRSTDRLGSSWDTRSTRWNGPSTSDRREGVWLPRRRSVSTDRNMCRRGRERLHQRLFESRELQRRGPRSKIFSHPTVQGSCFHPTRLPRRPIGPPAPTWRRYLLQPGRSRETWRSPFLSVSGSIGFEPGFDLDLNRRSLPIDQPFRSDNRSIANQPTEGPGRFLAGTDLCETRPIVRIRNE